MTKNEMLNYKLAEAGFILCIPVTEFEAKEMGFSYYLYNDYYSACGGYRLSKRFLDSGAVSNFAKETRLSYKEYLTYLQGIIDGARFSERIQ